MTRFEKKLVSGIIAALMLVMCVGTSGYTVYAADADSDKSMEAVKEAFNESNDTYSVNELTDNEVISNDVSFEDAIVSAGSSNSKNDTPKGPVPTESNVESKDGLYVYNVYGTEGIGIVSYKGTDTAIELPSQIDGKTVVSVDEKAFYKNEAITQVTIPSTVTRVQYSAFEGTTNLKKVEFATGSALKTISGAAFYKSGITGIDIPEGTTDIQKYAFAYCSNLTEAVIPGTVQNMETCIFRQCKALVNVKLGEGLKYIGDRMFMYCSSLSDIHIPETVTTIKDYTFYATGLKSVTISDNITKLGYYAAITEINVPANIKTIDRDAFRGCSELVTVNLSEGLEKLAGFNNCSSITEVGIPSTVTTIGYYAFDGCKNIETIRIPDSVTTISVNAFSHCTALKEIVIPDSVVSLGAWAFAGDTSLSNVVISNRLTYIPDYAFTALQR